MSRTIQRVLTGAGISAIFGGFPTDLTIGEIYTLYWDFEMKQYMISVKEGEFKAASFEWQTPLPK